MRILLGIAIVAVLVVAAWASIPTVAKHDGIVSIDPTSLTVTKTNLPTEQYDAF
jgi:hypothetical protein